MLRDIFMRRSRGENTTVEGGEVFISFSSKSSTHVTLDVIRDVFDDGVMRLDGLINDGGTNGEDDLWTL